MNGNTFIRRDTVRRGGFTLLEVVIALAIFAFGALAIIRIFPPALGVIQNSGDELTAINLDRSRLTRLASEPDLVPDAIYDDLPGTWRNNLAGSVAGTGRQNNSIPVMDVQDYDASALAHFKQIVGERHIVPANGVVLTQFPFVVSTTAPAHSMDIFIEDTLSGVMLGNDGTLDLTKAIQDSNNAAYTPTAKDVLYVSYQWVENGRIWGIEEEPVDPTVTAPKVSESTRFGTPPSSTFHALDGEVKVRLRRPLSSAPTSFPNADFGQFVLPATLAGQTVSLDYQVKDWRWLVFDGVPTVVPDTGTATQRAINLPVHPLDDQRTPAFLFSLFPSHSATPDLQTAPSSGTTKSLVDVNRKSGQVIFDVSSAGTEAPNARVVYASLDNWTHQLSVAARYYKPATSAPGKEEWRDYTQTSFDNFLYFKPSEAGKTVEITYSYRKTGDPKDTQMKNRILNIDTDLIDITTTPGFSSISSFSVGNRVSRLRLQDSDGNDLSYAVTSISQVRGMSIQARTAWLDGDHFHAGVNCRVPGREQLMKQARKSGFTLVELMVVIAIAAILASITFGAFRSITEGNKGTSCQANLSQIYQSCRLYAQDYNGNFPYLNWDGAPAQPATPKGGIGLWSLYTYRKFQDNNCSGTNLDLPPVSEDAAQTPALSGYVKTAKIFHCPADNYDRNIQYRTSAAGACSSLVWSSLTVTFKDQGRTYLNPAYMSYQSADDVSAPPASPPPVYTYSSFRVTGPVSAIPASKNAPRQLTYFVTQGRATSTAERPPSDTTVVTWCRFHRSIKENAGEANTIPGARNYDNVLFYDGTVQNIPSLQTVHDVAGNVGTCSGWLRVPRERADSMKDVTNCVPGP